MLLCAVLWKTSRFHIKSVLGNNIACEFKPSSHDIQIVVSLSNDLLGHLVGPISFDSLCSAVAQSRYDEIVSGLTPFLRSCGYQPKKDIVFLPMSGLLGYNLKDPLPKGVAPWSVLFPLPNKKELKIRDSNLDITIKDCGLQLSPCQKKK